MHDILNWLFDKLWILVGALVAYIWTSHTSEIKELKAAIAKKADVAEMDRQRDNIAKLFDEHNAIRREMSKGFEDVKDAIHRGNVEIIRELARKADR
jgi:predicted Holliday junction resolvase-like endonuclease